MRTIQIASLINKGCDIIAHAPEGGYRNGKAVWWTLVGPDATPLYLKFEMDTTYEDYLLFWSIRDTSDVGDILATAIRAGDVA